MRDQALLGSAHRSPPGNGVAPDLTADGGAILDQLAQSGRDLEDGLLTGLDEIERKSLQRLLVKIVRDST